MALVKRVK